MILRQTTTLSEALYDSEIQIQATTGIQYYNIIKAEAESNTKLSMHQWKNGSDFAF